MSQHTSQTSGPYTVLPIDGHDGIPILVGSTPVPPWVAFLVHGGLSFTALGAYVQLSYHMSAEKPLDLGDRQDLAQCFGELQSLHLVSLEHSRREIQVRYFPDLNNPRHVAAVKAAEAQK